MAAQQFAHGIRHRPAAHFRHYRTAKADGSWPSMRRSVAWHYPSSFIRTCGPRLVRKQRDMRVHLVELLGTINKIWVIRSSVEVRLVPSGLVERITAIF